MEEQIKAAALAYLKEQLPSRQKPADVVGVKILDNSAMALDNSALVLVDAKLGRFALQLIMQDGVWVVVDELDEEDYEEE